jgi:hypothetical protein
VLGKAVAATGGWPVVARIRAPETFFNRLDYTPPVSRHGRRAGDASDPGAAIA